MLLRMERVTAVMIISADLSVFIERAIDAIEAYFPNDKIRWEKHVKFDDGTVTLLRRVGMTDNPDVFQSEFCRAVTTIAFSLPPD